MGMVSKIDEKFDKFDWLAGFFEGDGTLIVNRPSVKNGRSYKCSAFRLDQKEADILRFVKESVIGFGAIYKASESCFALTVTGRNRNKLIARYLQNRIRTRKRTQQFNRWARTFGFKYTKQRQKISLSWLAGFFDADGWTHARKQRQFVSSIGKYVMRRGLIAGVAQKDPEILHRIKEIFGGHVYKAGECCSLQIASRFDVLRFIESLRPYLRNPHKIKKLERDYITVLKYRRKLYGHEVA